MTGSPPERLVSLPLADDSAHTHRIRWWSRGGRTDLDNLALVCTFNGRLAHEHGWNLERPSDGVVRWFRPGGVRYRAEPLAA